VGSRLRPNPTFHGHSQITTTSLTNDGRYGHLVVRGSQLSKRCQLSMDVCRHRADGPKFVLVVRTSCEINDGRMEQPRISKGLVAIIGWTYAVANVSFPSLFGFDYMGTCQAKEHDSSERRDSASFISGSCGKRSSSPTLGYFHHSRISVRRL
jgi:hypothetical protein